MSVKRGVFKGGPIFRGVCSSAHAIPALAWQTAWLGNRHTSGFPSRVPLAQPLQSAPSTVLGRSSEKSGNKEDTRRRTDPVVRPSRALVHLSPDFSTDERHIRKRDTPAEPRPANWKIILLRSAGFGGGFAIVAALLLGGIIWWSNRPKPWSESAVTAKPTEIYTRQVDEEVP